MHPVFVERRLSSLRVRVCLENVVSASWADVRPELPARRNRGVTREIAVKTEGFQLVNVFSGQQDAAPHGQPEGLPLLFKPALRAGLKTLN